MTEVRNPGVIRSRDFSKRAVADPPLRRHGRRDRRIEFEKAVW